MARDDWPERLEAYLDGELDPAAAAAFASETAADPARRAELAERQAFREAAQRALAGGVPVDLAAVARGVGRDAMRPADVVRDRPTARGRGWRVLAIAATLVLVLVAPRLLRNDPGAEGPRSPINRAGQVAAVRFGEQPGETVILEAGRYDSTSDLAY